MRSLLFRLLLLIVVATLMGLVLFLPAGRLNLPWFWAYLAWYVILALSGLSVLGPDLLKERLQPGPGARDQVSPLLGKALSLAHFVIAGLDVGRFGWSGNMSAALHVAGLGVMTAGAAFSIWGIRVNPFFSTAVRLQSERGHRVIAAGPYAFVRHPGYIAVCLLFPASSLALGSWWSLIPAVVAVGVILRRTALEDRFLHTHLEGYAAYAQRVRYRLVPGVW